MNAISLALTMIWITSCAGGGAISDLMSGNLGQPTRPAQAQSQVALPTPPPPQIVHLLRLLTPGGGHGELSMIKTIEYRREDLHIPGKPTYRTSSQFKGQGRISLKDEIGDWEFSYSALDMFHIDRTYFDAKEGLHGLGIRFSNRSSDTVEVDWNRTVLIAASGQALRVIHRGVRLADRGGIMPPSIIPPGAILEDFVFPSDTLRFSTGRTSGWWEAMSFFEEIGRGTRMTLTMGLKIKDATVSKGFTFQTYFD